MYKKGRAVEAVLGAAVGDAATRPLHWIYRLLHTTEYMYRLHTTECMYRLHTTEYM